MNAPYAQYILVSDGHMYPYADVVQFKIAVVENTHRGFPPDAIYRLEPDGFGFRYNEIDVDELLKPVETPITEIESLVA